MKIIPPIARTDNALNKKLPIMTVSSSLILWDMIVNVINIAIVPVIEKTRLDGSIKYAEYTNELDVIPIDAAIKSV